MDTDTRLRMLTARQVAQQLNVPLYSAYELIRSGELRAARIGRRVRVSPVELDAYVARCTNGGEQRDG